MASHFLLRRDRHRRVLVQRHEVLRRVLRSLVCDQTLQPALRVHCRRLLETLPRDSSAVRVRNRCVLTGRGRGVLRFCRLSRIAFRHQAGAAQMLGVVKHSW